jgi:hypothetical protein
MEIGGMSHLIERRGVTVAGATGPTAEAAAPGRFHDRERIENIVLAT